MVRAKRRPAAEHLVRPLALMSKPLQYLRSIQMGKYRCIVGLLLLLLTACVIEKSQTDKLPHVIQPTNVKATSMVFPAAFTPTETKISTVTNADAVTSVLLTPSPSSTISVYMTPNADQVARWQEYEKALANKIVPSPIPENVLCEWVILGQSESEVYLWAFCQSSGEIPTRASVPAVVYLGTDGAVQSVEIPGDGSLYPVDVHRLFPAKIQEIIFEHLVDVRKMEEHIGYRMENPEPPLLILDLTVMP